MIGNALEGDFPELALPCLSCLFLQENSISEMRSRIFLPCLRSLSLRSNELSDLNGIQRMVRLRYLDVSFNEITDLKRFEDLKELRQLESLVMNDNPLGIRKEKIKEELTVLCPRLQSLNNDPVSPQERNRAILQRRIRYKTKKSRLLLKNF